MGSVWIVVISEEVHVRRLERNDETKLLVVMNNDKSILIILQVLFFRIHDELKYT